MPKLTMLLLIFSFMLSTIAFAAPPDAGNILKEMEDKPAALPERKPESPIKTVPDKKPALPTAKVLIKEFRITGATLIPLPEIREALSSFYNRELTIEELNMASQRIVQLYADRGYIANAFFPPQEIKEGVVTLEVVEGKLEKIEIDPNSKSRFDSNAALGYLRKASEEGSHVDLNKLTRGLLLLGDLPGVKAAATLQSGTVPGSARLLVRLDDVKFVTGWISFDNFGSKSAGEYRLGLNSDLNNLSGFGDHLGLRFLSSIDTNYGRLAYSLPLGKSGLKGTASVSYMQYELTGDFKSLDASGDAFITGIKLNYPVIRSRSKNLYSHIGYDFKKFTNESLGAEISDKRLHVGNVGSYGETFDNFQGGGYNAFGVYLSFGNVDLSHNSTNKANDQAGPGTDGEYFKIQYNLSRLQRIADRLGFYLSLNGQFSGNNLDTSEQFSLGGPYGVRAYPVNEGNGDHGMLLTTEIRYDIPSGLQLFGFYDLGWIQQHKTSWLGSNAGGSPNSYKLDGIGGGVTWIGFNGRFNIKGTIATRLMSNPALTATGHDNDGTKREPRFWIQANASF